MSLTKISQRSTNKCDRCGSSGLYWAQDDNSKFLVEANHVTKHADVGSWISDRHVHACHVKRFESVTGRSVDGTKREETPAPEPTPEEQQVPAPYVPAPAPKGDDAALLDLLRERLGGQTVNREQVEAIVREAIGDIVFPTTTVVLRDEVAYELPGVQHQSMPKLISALSLNLNVLLVGPTGTGKSYMASQAAKALGLEAYQPPSMTSQTTEAKFAGFIDAGGTYHPTEVYRWATNPDGGLIILDELDNGNPNVNGWWNTALANRFIVFPNGVRAELTKNHLVAATANTYGFGRSREFVGRNPVDFATKSRFIELSILIDDTVEHHMVLEATAGNRELTDRILKYARKLRVKADENVVNALIDPRGTVAMGKMLGHQSDIWSWDDAVTACLRHGVDDDKWAKLGA